MLLLTTNTPITNPNAPIYDGDAAADALLALGPSLWLEARAQDLEISGGEVLGWVDRVSGRRYAPTRAARPQAVAFGSRLGLRMVNTPMGPEGGYEILNASGTHTIIALVRFPAPNTEGMAEPGNLVLGSTGGWTNFRVSISNTAGSLGVAQGGVSINGHGVDYRDGDWHLIVISVPSSGVATASVVRRDGALSQTFTSLKPPAAEGQRQLLIGGHGAQGAENMMTGFVGGVMYIPDRAVHLNETDLAVVENYWMARLAERTGG